MDETELTENNDTARKALDAFLVDNAELEKLTARLSQFNLFQVLRAEKTEIRHSNVLGWLLDPKQNHGLDDKFVRRFISRLLLEKDDVDIFLSPAQIELMRFEDLEVYREWKNIDVFVKSDTNKFCLIIENKIKSRESLGQLLKYKGIVEKEYPGFQVIPILLTLEGDDPSEEGQGAGFIALSHTHVLDLLITLTDQYFSRLPDDIRIFMEHYISTLRRLTMQDEELVNLCRSIYRKHRDAIELIVQFGAASKILDSCQDAVSEIIDPVFTVIARNRVWFLPKEMAKHQKPVLSGWKYLPERLPVVWWFQYQKKRGKIQLTMEMGPVENSALRIRLLKKIQDAGFKIGDKAFREEALFTRISTLTRKLSTNEEGEIDDTDEYLHGLVKSMWEKSWGENSGIVDVFKNFKW